MRKGKAVTIYLDEYAYVKLDEIVEKRAKEDKEKGLTGYSVTNRSKLISEIVTDYLVERNEEGDVLTIEKIAELIKPVLKKHGVKRAELFGSYARGEQTPESDVDLLIDPTGVEGFEFFRVQRELSETLGKPVDLQSINGSNERFNARIKKDRVILYAS